MLSLSSSGALDPSSGKGIQRRSNGVSAGSEPSRSHPPESPRGTGTTEQLRALVPCGSQIEAGGPQEVLDGEQAAAPTCRQVLTLSLRNPGNLCYQNAFVMSWLWSITNATHQVREHGDGLGRSAPLVSALLSGNHNRLSGIFHWSSILQGWSRPQIQHDVAAFATHALTRLRSPVMCGTWYAKREDPHCRVVDEGPLHLPLPIATPAEAATLQECLDSWHQQDAVHAVGVAPPLLALQPTAAATGRPASSSTACRRACATRSRPRSARKHVLRMLQSSLGKEWDESSFSRRRSTARSSRETRSFPACPARGSSSPARAEKRWR